MGRSRPRAPAAIACNLAREHAGSSMIGRAGPAVGLAAKVVGREVACLAIGPCGHTHCTTTTTNTTAAAAAAAGQATRVSVQRASSWKGLALAEGNRRPSLCVLLVNNHLIPATEIGRRCSTCGTPVGWQVSPEGIIILGSLAALWGQFYMEKQNRKIRQDMSMSKRMREERYKLCTSSHPHMLSKVIIPWQHVRCLLMHTKSSKDALLMKINTTHTEIANTE